MNDIFVPHVDTAPPESVLPPSFPPGDYTPFGYLDNPHHSMVLNRSGMLRSVPPLGFALWLRSFKGAYGNGHRGHVNYVSQLQLGIATDDLRLVTAADFEAAGIRLVSKYHTKHVLSYDFAHGPLTFSLRYYLARENTLACQIEVANSGDAARDVYLHAAHIYGQWEQRWWGADGLGYRYNANADAAVTAIWAYGDYFALGSDAHSVAHKATGSAEQCAQWMRSNDLTSNETVTVRGAGPMHSLLSYRITVPAEGRTAQTLCLSRGRNEGWTIDELNDALACAGGDLERQLDADEAFWSACPQLEGDWPEAWKRGWVYDWETLRMNVRPPVGIFAHHWDAMQIHSPRSVLGEASVDMLMLHYADPERAKEVMLGTFVDAPAPNVPCCREDGSMNMIAADGEACGTSPSWCWPFKVLRVIHAATGDDGWIKELYPYLKTYLEWWLTYRADENGWFHCHCDWESGQDGSKRFPEGEGGTADTVATVDVEASMAEAFQIMAQFAEIADALEDRPRWNELAEQKTAATRQMFFDGWFRDLDTRTGKPILLGDWVDIMMLTPVTCGVATAEQVAQLKERIAWFRKHNAKIWLEWPSFFLGYCEACWHAGLHLLAGEVTADIADRVYPRIDARAPRFADSSEPFAYRIPGVACEYWPLEDETVPGGEGYGWGATLPIHIIRDVIGLRETADTGALAFHMTPALPERLLTPGCSYGLRGFSFREVDVTVRYEVQTGGALALTVECTGAAPFKAELRNAAGVSLAVASEVAERQVLQAAVTNGSVYTVMIELE